MHMPLAGAGWQFQDLGSRVLLFRVWGWGSGLNRDLQLFGMRGACGGAAGHMPPAAGRRFKGLRLSLGLAALLIVLRCTCNANDGCGGAVRHVPRASVCRQFVNGGGLL